jgi:Bacterial SH3 domain
MRWLATRWRAAPRAQQWAFVAVALLVVIGAGVAIAGLGRAPIESPSASALAGPDTTAPTLAEVRGVPSDNPRIVGLTYAFSSDEAGTIAYLGACTSDRTAAKAGNNALTLSFLRPGLYPDCTLQVTDAAGNVSAPLAITPFKVNPPPPSIARMWNEALLSAIRIDRARPPVQARNLFHTSAAMYDIWAAYEGTADTYLFGHPGCEFAGELPPNREESEREAISFAMFRLINHRFSGSPGLEQTLSEVGALMRQLGYDSTDVTTDYSSGSAAALGNYVAQCYANYGLRDGSNEEGLHGNTYYQPVNGPLQPPLPGTQVVADLDRWQPLLLDVFVDQSGNVIVGGAPPFVGAEWGNVSPFAMTADEMTTYHRDSNRDGVVDSFKVYHDPGPPPSHLGATADEFWWNFALVAKWSGELDPSDGVMIDVSPASIGNDAGAERPLPTTLAEYQAFYDSDNGGDRSPGHALNPKTGKPYAPQVVARGDYARILAEFWADGPSSETPPGHWFTILNYVTDQLPPDGKRFGGEGPVLDDLAWDVKSYFTLGGGMHDAAIAAWGVKGWYDFVRPITAIRAMDTSNITLEPGFIERVQVGDPLAGESGVSVGKIKIRAWRGPTVVNDPATETAGVDWILAENWWPYQRPTFVTPPFAGYVSGHSTYSRAGADILTAITGDPYFPGGLGEFQTLQNDFLVFEDGPTQNITLQWATYRDAADQCSLSRIWGGIHPPFDDIPGRRIGTLVAADAFDLAEHYFAGTAPPPRAATPAVIGFAIGDRLRVSTRVLNLRAGASTKTDIVRGLVRGEIVTVTSDPVYAGGFIWYGVVDAKNRSGFVAMGGGTTPWLVPAD